MWGRLKRAARDYHERRAPGVHPAIWWAALAVMLAVAAVLVIALVPRSDERASTVIFFGTAAGAAVAAFLSWKASRAPRKRTQRNAEQRRYLENRAVILASLISRGASELAALRESWPEDAQLLARQQQNEYLRLRGLWDQLEPAEHFLSSSAQGSWSEDDAAMTYTWCEQLRLLRWVLGLDQEIAALEDAPEPDWNSVRATLDEPFEDPHKPMLASWDVRVERDKAAEYTARVLAEFAHRGHFQNGQADTSSMLRWRNFVSGTARDLKLGKLRIGELDDETLQVIASVAAARWHYAAYLVDALEHVPTPSLEEWEAAHTENGAPIADGTRWQ